MVLSFMTTASVSVVLEINSILGLPYNFAQIFGFLPYVNILTADLFESPFSLFAMGYFFCINVHTIYRCCFIQVLRVDEFLISAS